MTCDGFQTIEILETFFLFFLFAGPIVDLAISYNGEFCCTISDDKIVKVFDVINFGKLCSFCLRVILGHVVMLDFSL